MSNIAKKGSHLHTCYASMKQRCYYANGSNYKYYGGRGITICDEWLSDKNAFFQWSLQNGYQAGLSLDRINSDGNYEPSNCRWVHIDIQKQNKRVRHNSNSGYTGVAWSNIHNKYRADINVNKKRTHLGLFQCKHEAAIAYNNFIIKNKLSHRLNDIRR
ncbi:MAG TPA: hypothetical protein VFM18_23500 [Methanosarcina sp.]|nr:hypothetical protein [Methanosarcina sp.]